MLRAEVDPGILAGGPDIVSNFLKHLLDFRNHKLTAGPDNPAGNRRAQQAIDLPQESYAEWPVDWICSFGISA